jgi:hypothetical protein
MKELPNGCQIFKTLVDDANPATVLCQELCHYICALYGHNTVTSVNDVQYSLFCLGSYSDECLPPTYNCLLKHIQ